MIWENKLSYIIPKIQNNYTNESLALRYQHEIKFIDQSKNKVNEHYLYAADDIFVKLEYSFPQFMT